MWRIEYKVGFYKRVKGDTSIMKLHRIAARVLAGLALATVISAASLSSASADTNILTVNSARVFAESKVGQNLKGQITTLGKKLQAEIAKAQQDLQAEAKKLKEQQGLLKEDDFAKKVRAFEQKERDTQTKYDEKGRALQRGINVAQGKVQQAIIPLLDDVVKAHGGGVMLEQGAVLAGGTDVTADVIKALDGKLTSVTVTPVSEK